jgi:protein-S-isoprenylcysteine O-methyltransferase Ste14
VSPDENFVPLMVVQSCGMLVLLGLILVWPGPWNAERSTGLALAIPVAALFFLARLQLGRSFSVTPQARELVTRGVYSKIRNPIYLSRGLMFLCLAIALQLRYLLLLFVILIAVPVIRARRETKVLEEKVRRRLPRIQEKDLVLDSPSRLQRGILSWHCILLIWNDHIRRP